MEEACLNSEPVFDDGDEFTVDGDCQMLEHGYENGEVEMTKEPPNPNVGLEFDSFEEAYDFYNLYAKERGFGIRVSNSWFRSKRKERYRAKLSCSSAGFKKKSRASNPRPETRTGCPAMVVIRMVDSRRWRIVEVELDHNHQVNPQINRFYKSHKRMILSAKNAETPPHSVTEVHTIKLYRTALMESGCNGCSSSREREGVDHSKHLKLKEGDVQALYNYFCRMKLTNPNFFYLMDFDDDGRLRNVFWADARARAAYSYFCDTITIDTTCLVSKFEIPLISFVGVNNHGQSVLLGCGFLGHESVDYFAWMLEAWLNCMLGCPPQVIITDQCKPLQSAVSQVLPNARHCYCLGYIMQRVPEKLGGLKGFGAIKGKLNRAVYSSLKIAEFETSWVDMINYHTLGDNKWLQTLYEERQLWVPVYLKDVFFAGMIPLDENETMASFFDGYVLKHTSFKEFVDKYDLALHRKHTKEVTADQESRNSNFELKTVCNFERQLSGVYTKGIFRKFQSEVEGMYSCFNTRQVKAEGTIVTYVVKEQSRFYEVLFETTQVEVRCICSLLSYKGYLCRHALSVLDYNGIEEIPARYVLPRWSKDFKCVFPPNRSYTNSVDAHDPLYSCNHLLKLALPVVEEGAKSRERYKIALRELEALVNKLNVVEDIT